MDLAEFSRDGLGELLRFAHALIGDQGTAEDVCQEVLIRLFVKPRAGREVRDVHAYARRMVVNEYLSWGRKWFRVRPQALFEEPISPTDPADVVSERDALRRELARLAPKQRAALVLRFYAGMNDDTIAEHLGCSVSTVRTHISRGLSTLRVESTQPEPSGQEFQR